MYADRVRETTTTTGTGDLSLAGAVTGFQSFVVGVGDTATVTFLTTDGTDWEVSQGIVSDSSVDTLSRDTILASSNGGAAVNWGAGTKDVLLVTPAVLKNTAFLATNSATDGNVTGNGTQATVDFDTELFDDGNNFAADTFTAPIDGKYFLETSVRITGLTSAADDALLELIVGGSAGNTYTDYVEKDSAATGDLPSTITLKVAVVANMSVGDTAIVAVTVNGEVSDVVDVVGGGTVTKFSGFLLA